MKIVIEKNPKKNKNSVYAKFLLVAAFVIALVGVAALTSTIYQFCYYIKEYTAQGYSTAVIVKSFLMTQLVPGVADSLALYGGVSIILFTARKIFIKIFELDKQNIKIDAEEKAEINNADNVETEAKE
ncbi:MAG: hypothetical protein GYA50_02400 [Eubacteriaceae bacterium]|nr:hypothetical protein [Eubacteriaceae bacterium]